MKEQTSHGSSKLPSTEQSNEHCAAKESGDLSGGRGGWRDVNFIHPLRERYSFIKKKKNKKEERRGSRAGFAAYPNAIAFSKTLSSSLTNTLFRLSGVRSPIPRTGHEDEVQNGFGMATRGASPR